MPTDYIPEGPGDDAAENNNNTRNCDNVRSLSGTYTNSYEGNVSLADSQRAASSPPPDATP